MLLHQCDACSQLLYGQRRGNERLWRRLARAPEAVAGVPLAGPRPGSTEPPRAARRALRRHRSRGGGTGAELGHRPDCTLTMRQLRELSPLPLLVQPVGLSARQLDISLRDLLLLLVLERAASGGERVSESECRGCERESAARGVKRRGVRCRGVRWHVGRGRPHRLYS